MGYLNYLKHLYNSRGLTLDSNIDLELFIDFSPAEQVIYGTKVDCFPINADQKSGSSFQANAPDKSKQCVFVGDFVTTSTGRTLNTEVKQVQASLEYNPKKIEGFPEITVIPL